jgi:2-polyprenyl-3-methyl-5-hydroxy-6-metoxy-1,4-benzoquinol methylase
MVMAHSVSWTAEKVSAFWEVNHAMFSRRRFSQQVGPALRKLIRKNVLQGSTILDFGCGNGSLLRQLNDGASVLIGFDLNLPNGFSVLPADVSVHNWAKDRLYFSGNDSLARLQGVCDAVLLIEVVEHLDDQALGSVLGDCSRLLRRGGVLLVTTPNEEILQDNTVNCPDCGCVFHRVQHVRSWSGAHLDEAIAGYGFRSRTVSVTDMGQAQRSFVSRMIRGTLDRLDRRKMPHLVGIFERT